MSPPPLSLKQHAQKGLAMNKVLAKLLKYVVAIVIAAVLRIVDEKIKANTQSEAIQDGLADLIIEAIDQVPNVPGWLKIFVTNKTVLDQIIQPLELAAEEALAKGADAINRLG